MATYSFYTNPMSRGRTVRWALHEVGASYRPVIVSFGPDKPAEFLAANTMAKVPVLVHHVPEGDRVITEAAAICAYLAEAHPEAGLAPTEAERADYLRWLFFAAGPIESAIMSKALGFEPNERQQAMAGWGTVERTVAAIDLHLASHPYVCGERFTMADVYVGSALGFGTGFGMLPLTPAVAAYLERVRARPAYGEATAIDDALIPKEQPA